MSKALRADSSDGHSSKLTFEDPSALQILCGERNKGLKLLERAIGVELHTRGNEVTVRGGKDDVVLACSALNQLYRMAANGRPLDSDDLVRAVRVLQADHNAELRDIFSDTVLVPRAGRPIAPKGLAQKRYVDAVRANDMVFAVGPAGTGKTYLAMAMAVAELIEKRVKRIVLTRPAVEAGERLGFLPGDLEDKVNPYLRPLYDALHDMLDYNKVRRLMERDTIEVAPLAFMRGRTLNDSFVILDEAQNTTTEQMKMFLTRLGYGSKAVITGDVTQSDLPSHTRSGLAEAAELLDGIDGISICWFTERDVVRHPLVHKIIRAYASRGRNSTPPRTAADPPAGPANPADPGDSTT